MIFIQFFLDFQIFNSRTCQLVLGAGALELVGLKTISTKNLGKFSCKIKLRRLCFTQKV